MLHHEIIFDLISVSRYRFDLLFAQFDFIGFYIQLIWMACNLTPCVPLLSPLFCLLHENERGEHRISLNINNLYCAFNWTISAATAVAIASTQNINNNHFPSFPSSFQCIRLYRNWYRMEQTGKCYLRFQMIYHYINITMP